MRKFNHDEILNLDKYFRINLINTASGIGKANLIGSASDTSETNLAVFNSVVHIGANPPCLGFIVRPHVVERHTYENIKTTGYYTINQINLDIHRQAHQTSAKYSRTQSEFDECKLTQEYIDDFPSPFVKESKIKIGLSFIEEHKIAYNDTIMVIGKIEKLLIQKGAIEEDGCIDHTLIQTMSVSGLNSYYKNTLEHKLDFARP